MDLAEERLDGSACKPGIELSRLMRPCTDSEASIRSVWQYSGLNGSRKADVDGRLRLKGRLIVSSWIRSCKSFPAVLTSYSAGRVGRCTFACS